MNDKDVHSNVIVGKNICEISKLPTLKGYMNNYGTEYKIFIRRQKEHQIKTHLNVLLKEISKLLRTPTLE